MVVLTGGMAWEALNNAAHSDTNVLIVINDNQMGIDPNAGALNQYLNESEAIAQFLYRHGVSPIHHTSDGHDWMYLYRNLKSINVQ